jgi:formate hydrogenlyase subunit 3/multisubunit Na+/H+ antiporter MnhD subunit
MIIAKVFIVFLLVVSYVALGILIYSSDSINHPAYWSLYGAMFGGMIVAAVDLR